MQNEEKYLCCCALETKHTKSECFENLCENNKPAIFPTSKVD